MDWTAAKIDGLAPDASSVAAGRKLTNATNWLTRGVATSALWGECKGSGKNPYQVRIDLNGPAYRCSCPSRKIPCKHCLGLLYLYAASAESFQQDAPPEWLTAWLVDRQTRETKKAERVEKKVTEETPEAREKRTVKRLEKAIAGFDELSLRLCDLVREGLGAAPSKPFAFWDQAARRLMDAQAPGAARRVRHLAAIPASGEAWPERMLAGMGALSLMVSAAQHFDGLSPETQADLGAAMGWVEKKESILALPGHHDTWCVLAVLVEDDEEARLRVRQTWLWGRKSGLGALLLDFSAGQQPFPTSWFPGSAFDGELVFYPGSYPLRAIAKGVPIAQPFAIPSGYNDWEAALSARVDALAKNAWLGPFPMLIDDVRPWHADGQWVLIDRSGCSAPLAGEDEVLWALLAESGGCPMRLFGLWHEGTFYCPPADRIGGEIVTTPSASPRLRQLARSMMLKSDAAGHAIPSADGALGQVLSRLNGDQPAWRSLQAAAFIDAHDDAGWCAPCWHGAAPDLAPVDVRPEFSPAACDVLAQLASGRMNALWPEFLALAAASGQRAPSRFQPLLLNRAVRDTASRPDVLRILGPRGAWLCAFNEAWQALPLPEAGGHEDTAIWETGTLEARTAWLASLQQRDPDAAREILASEFKKEPAATRVAFIDTMSEVLSMADEDFLEAALDDKSKRVAGIAAALLRRLPESRLVARACEQLRAQIGIEKSLLRTRLHVSLPEELTPAMERDGYEERLIPGLRLGKKASMLAQLVACAPLRFWAAHLQRDLPELLKLASKTDFELALVHGWQDAAIRERSSTWLEILIRRASVKEHAQRREQLIQALPPDALARHLVAQLSASASFSPYTLARDAATLPQPWPVEFGHAVLQWMRRHAATVEVSGAGYGRTSLEQLAVLLPPLLLEEAQDGWPFTSPAWESLVKNPDNFHALLKIRHQLNREFEK